MTVLFYLGHPGHYHLFKHAADDLEGRGGRIVWVVKHKDVLADLLRADGRSFHRVSKGSKRNLAATAFGLVRSVMELWRIARDEKPDVLMGTAAEIAHVGRLLGVPGIVANEDDWDAIPLFSYLAFPAATHILAPFSCPLGRWEDKRIGYHGYHELAYLHPDRFTPDESVVRRFHAGPEPYSLVRLSALAAHHDRDIGGLSDEAALRLIELLETHGAVYLSSERPLPGALEPYRIRIAPSDMHHVLAFASLYIGDSQTMAAEAAVLGTPSVRYSDFAGRLGYLEELEHEYGLTFGIRTGDEARLLDTVSDLLSRPAARHDWAQRRDRMLAECVDLTAFLVWIIEHLDADTVRRRARDVARPFAARTGDGLAAEPLELTERPCAVS